MRNITEHQSLQQTNPVDCSQSEVSPASETGSTLKSTNVEVEYIDIDPDTNWWDAPNCDHCRRPIRNWIVRAVRVEGGQRIIESEGEYCSEKCAEADLGFAESYDQHCRRQRAESDGEMNAVNEVESEASMTSAALTVTLEPYEVVSEVGSCRQERGGSVWLQLGTTEITIHGSIAHLRSVRDAIDRAIVKLEGETVEAALPNLSEAMGGDDDRFATR